jgi:hypothetical protein
MNARIQPELFAQNAGAQEVPRDAPLPEEKE